LRGKVPITPGAQPAVFIVKESGAEKAQKVIGEY